MQLLEVKWVDAHNLSGGWNDKDELDVFAKDEAYKVTSVGFLVHEDDLCIVLAGRVSPATDNYEAHYGLLERLPKKIIDKRRIIK